MTAPIPEFLGLVLGAVACFLIGRALFVMARGLVRWITGYYSLKREIDRMRAEQAEHYKGNHHEW